jgi:hypothetical protein
MMYTSLVMFAVAALTSLALILLDPRVARLLGYFLLAWAEGSEWVRAEMKQLRHEARLILLGFFDNLRTRQQEMAAPQAVRS